MKNYIIRQYKKEDKAIWNTFISNAKNATFLFNRDFMDYHSDRFEDYSLLIFDESEKLVAVLPANRVGDIVYSHQGLSYGDLLLLESIRIKDYVIIFSTLLNFLSLNNVRFLEIKSVPKIYHNTLSDEIDYVTFLAEAINFRTDVYLAIDMGKEYLPNRNRKRALNIANKLNIEVVEDTDYESFWNTILTPNLNNRFNVKPVHSVEEIKKLAILFPEKIKLFNAYQDKKLKAGVVMFISDNVAHFQYSSGGEDRNDTAALDILFDFIVQKYSAKKYVSFGSSSENNGKKLNAGLAYWKESFGATSSVQKFYRFDTSNYYLLNSITDD